MPRDFFDIADSENFHPLKNATPTQTYVHNQTFDELMRLLTSIGAANRGVIVEKKREGEKWRARRDSNS